MVGARVSSTTSREKATIYLSVSVEFAKDTARYPTPQSTRMWRGRLVTLTMRASNSSRKIDASVLRKSFSSGMVLSSRR